MKIVAHKDFCESDMQYVNYLQTSFSKTNKKIFNDYYECFKMNKEETLLEYKEIIGNWKSLSRT